MFQFAKLIARLLYSVYVSLLDCIGAKTLSYTHHTKFIYLLIVAKISTYTNSRNASVKITFYYPCLVAQLISREDTTVTCIETLFAYKRL